MVIRSDSVPLHLLRKLTGKLLWVCSLFRPFRPSLGPLYRDQSLPPLVHVAVSLELWTSFRAALSPDLSLQREVGLASCPKGCTLVSVGSLKPEKLSSVPLAFPGERRKWISVRMPPDCDRKLSSESREILRMWQSCLSGDPPVFSLALAPLLPCEAFADACADARSAGIGGYVRLVSGRCVWFRRTLSASELCSLFPWFEERSAPQKFIVHFISRCDNAPSDSASWKGISTARGLCSLLRTYFSWQRHFCVSTYIDHVPGFRNRVADGLSRSVSPSDLGMFASDEVSIPWELLPCPPRPQYYPADALSASVFPAACPD